jgi:hypothetical protein
MAYMGYNIMNVWYIYDIYMLKKKNKRVKKLEFSPVLLLTAVTSIKKTFFQPRILKKPIICITSFCH